jgi:hypothetical protein
VRPEGVEPPTSWSVARHSIRLSYGRSDTEQLASHESTHELRRTS